MRSAERIALDAALAPMSLLMNEINADEEHNRITAGEALERAVEIACDAAPLLSLLVHYSGDEVPTTQLVLEFKSSPPNTTITGEWDYGSTSRWASLTEFRQDLSKLCGGLEGWTTRLRLLSSIRVLFKGFPTSSWQVY
jgi:hypothetical protein